MSLILHGARIRPRRSDHADAVLVVHDRITAVGTTADVIAAAPAGARRLDLAGRVLTPGLQDAHAHFFQMGVISRRASLAECRSLEDFRDGVARALRERPGPEPLFLESWDETAWDRPLVPTRELMDGLSADRPILARRICGHLAVVNTPGLALIRDLWPGGGIDADTGHLIEEPCLHLDVLLLPTAEEAQRAFDEADRMALSLGVTTSCDFLRPSALRRWGERINAGAERVRVNAFLLGECFEEPELLEIGSERFVIRGLKIWSDGTIGGRTAAVREDWHDRPGERGGMLVDPAAMTAAVAKAHGEGWAVAIHAIGDRAIDHALDSFAALPRGESRSRGHRIEHAEMVGPDQWTRMRDLGVRPCVQPNFLQWANPGGLYEVALGRRRLEAMNPFRSLLAAGCQPFFGSDGMPPSPAFGLRHAVEHPVEAERLTGDEALRLYTEAAAAGVPGHPVTGRIAPGEIADLAVFEDEPHRLPYPGSALLTILDGVVVHQGEGLERSASSC
ncbi:MAG: amidohydrolase [Gemmatimonadota bacterium]|nr:MAG: amidohydrolase [Gemmatimonadota bacterium]